MVFHSKIVESFARHAIDLIESDLKIKCKIIKKRRIECLPMWFPYNQYLIIEQDHKFSSTFKPADGTSVSVKKPSY